MKNKVVKMIANHCTGYDGWLYTQMLKKLHKSRKQRNKLKKLQS